ncbi:hypothetical protein PR202_ga06986 [Eleusine coracana subsp. coracana]|uniref:Uncharacterized protein n=1 Tax=Eleusine coracana subsp. coracana TaxID=191504 RepID=A0AAV5BYR8_ELECO|nr:hypothetical protein PR202_ga06986 [Eleusine coracana subsp. coracana]
MMTRARQRRRLLQRSRTTRDLGAPPGESPIATIQEEEWRDWANDLLPELVDDISGRLLAADVAEYLRFRAVDRIRRNLLNLSTAASLGVDLPPLSTHCHLCAADGLLVLYDRYTAVIRLVDPLTNVVTEFPPITAAVGSLSRPPEFVSECSRGVIFRTINGAAFDDSTAPPTLVLCLRGGICNIVVAKPGAAHWTRVGEGDAALPAVR